MISNEKFVELKEKLYSGVISDILDEKGLRHNALDGGIRPIKDGMKVFGRAYTVLATDVYQVPKEHYKLELEAVDGLKPGDIFVGATNGSTSCGFWGELLTTVAVKNGALGAVIDGHIRDAQQIIDMDFPLFARGYSSRDSLGRTDVIATKVRVKCQGVYINHGDLIFGDIDGLVVVPQEIEEEVIEKALKRIEEEDIVRKEMLEGKSATEVYDKYGIL